MKRFVAALLVFAIAFSLVSCTIQPDFSEFQGTWYCREHSFVHYIRIDGDQIYERIGSSAEFSHGIGLEKKGGSFYVLFTNDERWDISLSNDGTELNYKGDTFYKE